MLEAHDVNLPSPISPHSQTVATPSRRHSSPRTYRKEHLGAEMDVDLFLLIVSGRVMYHVGAREMWVGTTKYASACPSGDPPPA